MIKKIAYIGAIALLISSIISCEEDYTDVGSGIISNDKFDSKQMAFDVKVTPKDVTSVQADNIAMSVNEYLLGVYKPENYKGVKASIVSQLAYSGKHITKDLNSNDAIDSTYTLDKVIIKFPYSATKKSDGFRLDSILGNTSVKTSLKVLRNGTYLNELNPTNPSEKNTYQSNYTYSEGEILTESNVFEFMPKATDTIYVFQRSKMINGVAEKFNDTIKIKNKQGVAQTPFLAIPLDKNKMQTIFWDKFESAEFKTKEAFQDYFKGIIIKAESEDGALIPFDFKSKFGMPALEFHYTITRTENNVFKDVVKGKYSFPLSGITNAIYETTPAKVATPANNFTIQGTAGSQAEINILTDAQIEEIRKKNILINEASLTFYVNQNIDKNKNLVPQKLLLYKEETNKDGKVVDVQISDAYRESMFFGGALEITDNLPQKYTFRITNHLVNIIKGKQKNEPLKLKVYNFNTDSAIKGKMLDVSVKSYNWNPRGVTLYNESLSNKDKRVQLNISYSEEK